MKKYTKKNILWSGWSKEAPFGKERSEMYKKCGKKCFLGQKIPNNKKYPKFPICTKKTCKINTKGLYAAYIRARQWGKKKSTYKKSGHPRLSRKTYKNVEKKAKKMLKKRGFNVI